MLLETPWRATTIQVHFDGQVLAFTVGVSLATGLLFGVFPGLAQLGALHGLIPYVPYGTSEASESLLNLRTGTILGVRWRQIAKLR